MMQHKKQARLVRNKDSAKPAILFYVNLAILAPLDGGMGDGQQGGARICIIPQLVMPGGRASIEPLAQGCGYLDASQKKHKSVSYPIEAQGCVPNETRIATYAGRRCIVNGLASRDGAAVLGGGLEHGARGYGD